MQCSGIRTIPVVLICLAVFCSSLSILANCLRWSSKIASETADCSRYPFATFLIIFSPRGRAGPDAFWKSWLWEDECEKG